MKVCSAFPRELLIIALCVPLLLPPSARAIDPNPDVDKGTTPADWIYKTIGENKDKWDIQGQIPTMNYAVPFYGLSPGMLKILSNTVRQGENWNPPNVCDAVAVNQGWSGLSNSMMGGSGLAAALEGAGLIRSIMGAQKLPSLAGQAYKKIEKKIREAIEEGAEDKLKDLLKGAKPEAYTSRAVWGDCSLAIIAVWDKQAGTYEVVVYGDCGCKPIRQFMSHQQKKLKTFALRLTGTVSLKLEGNDIGFEAKSGPKAVHANCKCPAPGQPEPKEPPGKPQEPPAEIPVPPIPPEDVSTKCKECQPIVDQIKKAHVDLKKIMRDAQEAQDFYLAAVKAGRKKEASEFEVQVIQLGVQRLQVERKLKDLGGQLAECEKEKCTTKGPVATGPDQNAPQGTCPPCQELENQIKKIDADIQKKNIEVDNARRIWEKEGPDSEKGKKARADYDRLMREVENLSKQANDLQEKLAACVKEKCPPNAIDPCLVGTWVAASGEPFSGFRVTFKADGTQTVDYSGSQPQKQGSDTITWRGIGSNRISTKGGVATIAEGHEGTVTMTLQSPVVPHPVVWKFGTRMGFAGLGDTTGDNRYVCTRTGTQEKGAEEGQGDTLTFQGSTHRDRRPNYAVKLTRFKP